MLWRGWILSEWLRSHWSCSGGSKNTFILCLKHNTWRATRGWHWIKQLGNFVEKNSSWSLKTMCTRGRQYWWNIKSNQHSEAIAENSEEVNIKWSQGKNSKGDEILAWSWRSAYQIYKQKTEIELLQSMKSYKIWRLWLSQCFWKGKKNSFFQETSCKS